MTYLMPNATNVLTFLSYGNDVTSGWFWTICLIFLYIVMLGNLKINNSFEDSFAASSFFCGIIGIGFGILQWITGYVLLVSIVLAIIGGIVLLWRKTPTT